MPRNKTPVNELGTIYAHGAEFRAHVQFRADDGEQKNIYGPSRATENEAQKDLDQIRAAGGVGATREPAQPPAAVRAESSHKSKQSNTLFHVFALSFCAKAVELQVQSFLNMCL